MQEGREGREGREVSDSIPYFADLESMPPPELS